MNWYKITSLMVAIAGFVSTIAIIETPRKRKEVAHILPKVEDMYENPTPLQF